MANMRDKKSPRPPAVSGEASKNAPRATGMARGGDVLIENDVVYGHPDRDIAFGNESRGEELMKPPAPLEDDTDRAKSNNQRRR